jgi:hypothetical protein
MYVIKVLPGYHYHQVKGAMCNEASLYAMKKATTSLFVCESVLFG